MQLQYATVLPPMYEEINCYFVPLPGGHFGITLSTHLSVPWHSCLGCRHAGCLQLIHRRPPKMCRLWTHPQTDVDLPRFLPPSNCCRQGHIVLLTPGLYLVSSAVFDDVLADDTNVSASADQQHQQQQDDEMMSLAAEDDSTACKSDEPSVQCLATDLLSVWHSLKVSVILLSIAQNVCFSRRPPDNWKRSPGRPRTRSESLQPHPEQSSRPGSEPSSVEADVYVWRYTLLVEHAGQEEENEARAKLLEIAGVGFYNLAPFTLIIVKVLKVSFETWPFIRFM